MTEVWTMAVARDDLSRTTLLEGELPEIGAGEALLRVDKVGVTANNVTYGVLGEAFRYWEFFPTQPGWGLVPLWGFAEVVASSVDGLPVGERVYGYLPPSSHLVVRPGRADAQGFRDESPHRAALPQTYNAYVLTSGDPAYEARWENLQVLYRPLFLTSFLLADQLEDNAFFGADVIAVSSASSKTAYGTAFRLRSKGVEVVGLTSPDNVAFTEGLGCYDRVLTYEAARQLDAAAPTAYLDFAGTSGVRATLTEHLGERLVRDVIIGLTHQTPARTPPSPRSTLFFAPDQVRKRVGDWGREGFDQRFGEAWRLFAPTVEGWIDVVEQHGPEALRSVWLEVLAGHAAPRKGHVLTF